MIYDTVKTFHPVSYRTGEGPFVNFESPFPGVQATPHLLGWPTMSRAGHVLGAAKHQRSSPEQALDDRLEG